MKHIIFLLGFLFTLSNCFGQNVQATFGPVFHNHGAVYDVEADLSIDSTTTLKAIFDIGSLSKKPSDENFLINSLHRYYNLHVRNGVNVDSIELAFVLHGNSTVDALHNEAYKARFGIDNPNIKLIQSLAKHGVQMFVCGQSAAYNEIKKEDLLPDVKMALSAMTVLTLFQQNGYALIAF